MANGDVIQPGVSFLDIRSGLKNDPDYARLEEAYNSGTDFTQRYHRTWAQMEVALANAEYGFFFGDETTTPAPLTERTVDVIVSPNPASNGFINVNIKGLKDLNGKGNTNIISVRLLDLSGNVVRTQEIKDRQKVQARLSVEGLPAAIYILEVTDFVTKERARKKVVVK